MAQFYSPLSANVSMPDGSVRSIKAGMIDEAAYPQEMRDLAYVKGMGIKPESEMTDEDKWFLSQIGTGVFPAIMDNRPQSDVNIAGHVDARTLVAGMPAPDVDVPVGVTNQSEAKPILPAKAAASVSEPKVTDKPSVIPGPKPGQ